MPRDWAPQPGWAPKSSWPAPPPDWNFWIPENLLMVPLDLKKDVDLGPVHLITPQQLFDMASRAADSVAWRICSLAAAQKKVPMNTYRQYLSDIESTLDVVRRKLYSELRDDVNHWFANFHYGSSEWRLASRQRESIIDGFATFKNTARTRIVSVLSAVTDSN